MRADTITGTTGKSMDYNLLANYLNGMHLAFEMFKNEIISFDELIKTESFLLKKNCIKPNSVYRLNDLIIDSNRAIYYDERKE